jgi:hypothetical protein
MTRNPYSFDARPTRESAAQFVSVDVSFFARRAQTRQRLCRRLGIADMDDDPDYMDGVRDGVDDAPWIDER